MARRSEASTPSVSMLANAAAVVPPRLVTAARSDGYSWGLIGMALGTSGEAARQRYSHRGA